MELVFIYPVNHLKWNEESRVVQFVSFHEKSSIMFLNHKMSSVLFRFIIEFFKYNAKHSQLDKLCFFWLVYDVYFGVWMQFH